MDRIEEAMGELGAALVQVLPTDDQIIVEHIRRAHNLISIEWRERRSATQAAADTATALRAQADLSRVLRSFGL